MAKEEKDIGRQIEHSAAKIILTLIGIAVILFVAWSIYNSNSDIQYLRDQGIGQ